MGSGLKDTEPAPAMNQGPTRPARGCIGRLAGRLPPFTIAILVTLPLVVLRNLWFPWTMSWLETLTRSSPVSILLQVALFVPGAIHRWKGRQVLFMAGAGVATWGIGLLLAMVRPPVGNWALTACVQAAPLLLVVAMELGCRRTLSWITLAWAVPVALAAQSVLSLGFWCSWLSGWDQGFTRRGWLCLLSPWDLADATLIAVLLWAMVPAALSFVGTTCAWWRKAVLAGAIAFPVAGLALFLEVWSLPLARNSLLGHGPFARGASVRWVFTKGTLADNALLWKALEESQWRTSPGRWREDEDWFGSWQDLALRALAERDSGGTAEKLSMLLRRQPSLCLAESAAGLLAECRRYETAPLLMRYALAEGSHVCEGALEKMGIPEAAFPIMRNRIVYEAGWMQRRLERFDDSTRERLVRLLGQDPGTEVAAWLRLYDRIVSDLPSPMPQDLRKEVDRVIRTMLRYIAASNDWAGECLAAVKGSGLQGETALEEVRKRILAVARPDWNVLTTGDLEKEIDRYVSRVNEAMGLEGRPESTPDSRPLSGDGNGRASESGAVRDAGAFPGPAPTDPRSGSR
jgi:hypothetical protein